MAHRPTGTAGRSPIPWGVKAVFVLALFWLASAGLATVWLVKAWVQATTWPHLVWGESPAASVSAPSCPVVQNPLRTYQVIATAYSSDVGQTDDSPCITSTGFDLCQNYALYGATNTIAANFLPVHSIVKIPELYGDKVFVVRDRMNDRFADRIDIWMPTRAQAVRFGLKSVQVEVYGAN